MFSAIADLVNHTPIERRHYSEKFVWERRQYDPLTQSLAQYHKTKPAWIFLQAMAGGLDGPRSLADASLVRRYMDNCGSWRTSYRFALAIVQECQLPPSSAIKTSLSLRTTMSGRMPFGTCFLLA